MAAAVAVAVVAAVEYEDSNREALYSNFLGYALCTLTCFVAGTCFVT